MISPRELNRLHLEQLTSNDDGDSVLLGDGTTRVQRLGSIELDLHFAFLSLDTHVTRFTLKYAVIDIPFDVILGVEALRSLFPNDTITRFFPQPSHNASTPLYHRPLFHYHPYTNITPCPTSRLVDHPPAPLPSPSSPRPDFTHFAAFFMMVDDLNDEQLHNGRTGLEEAMDDSLLY